MHPPSVFVAGWAMSGESRSAGILGAHKILAELLCLCRSLSRNSLAATRSRSDFIYTEMVARRRFEFYLHRDSGYRKVVGDDASKNGDFERVKQRLQGYKKFQMCYVSSCHHDMSSWGAIFKALRGDVDEMIDFESVK